MKNPSKNPIGFIALLSFPLSSFALCSGLIFDSPQVMLSEVPFSPPGNSWLLDPRNRKQTIDISGKGIYSSEMFRIVDDNASRINSIAAMFSRRAPELGRENIINDPQMIERFLPLLVKWSTERGYQAAVDVIGSKMWKANAGRCIGDWELDDKDNLNVSIYIFVPHYNKNFPPELHRVYQYRLKFVKPDPSSIYLLDDVQPIKPAQARLADR